MKRHTFQSNVCQDLSEKKKKTVTISTEVEREGHFTSCASLHDDSIII